MVQMGWQMEISPTRTGRGVFVDNLVLVKQGRENKGEVVISSYNLFFVHRSQLVSYLYVLNDVDDLDVEVLFKPWFIFDRRT